MIKFHFRGEMKKILVILLMLSGIINSQSTWQSLDPPGGGGINGLICLTDSFFITGTQSGQIYKTTNGGELWYSVYDAENIGGNKFFTFFMQSDNGNILASLFGRGIILSEDKGETWQFVTPIHGENVCKSSDGRIFYNEWSNQERLFCSSDNGYNWGEIPKPGVSGRLSFAVLDTVIYYYIGNEFGYSSDYGETWHFISSNSQMPSKMTQMLLLDINSFYLTNGSAVYKSTDTGITWFNMSAGIPTSYNYIRGIYYYKNELFAFCDQGIFKFSIQSNSWHQIFEKREYHVSTLYGTTESLFCGNQEGIWKFESGVWKRKNKGIRFTRPKKIEYSNEGYLFLNSKSYFSSYDMESKSWQILNDSIYYQGVVDFEIKGSTLMLQDNNLDFYFSQNNGNTWQKTGNRETPVDLILSEINDNAYIAPSGMGPVMPGYGFFKSVDHGANWTWHSHRPDPGTDQFNNLYNMGNDLLLAGIYDYNINEHLGAFMIDANHHTIWTPIPVGLPEIYSYVYSGDNYFLPYAGNQGGIYKLNLRAKKWFPVAVEMTVTTEIRFTSSNAMVFLNNGAIFYLDENENRVLLSEELEFPIKDFVLDKDDLIYALDVRGGVHVNDNPIQFNPLPKSPKLLFPENDFVTENDTIIFLWQKATPAIEKYILQISNTPNFSYLTEYVTEFDTTIKIVVNTDSVSFWRVRSVNFADTSDFSEVRSFTVIPPLGVEQPTGEDIVYSFKLEQNYPNPFNPSTKISYSLDRPGETMLKIYNSIGELVLYENLGIKEQGEYSYNFNGELFPSGVYFYELAHSNGGNVRNIFNKMVLLK